FATAQALNGQMDGKRCRRAGGIHGSAGAMEIEDIRNPVGRDRQGVAGTNVGIDAMIIVGKLRWNLRVVGPTDSHKYARLRTGHPIGRVAGVLECLPRDLQQQPLLRIHPRGFTGSNSEELGFELVDVVYEPTPTGRHLATLGTRGIVESFDVPAKGRDFGSRFNPVANHAPVLL